MIKQVIDKNGVTTKVHSITCTTEKQPGAYNTSVAPKNGKWCIIPLTIVNNSVHFVSAESTLNATIGNVGTWPSDGSVSTLDGKSIRFLNDGGDSPLATPGQTINARYLIDVKSFDGYAEIQTGYYQLDSSGNPAASEGFTDIDLDKVSP